MKTTKILMLAAATVLSIGAGAAMAQDGAGAAYDWQAAHEQAQIRAMGKTSATQESAPQYGSADRSPMLAHPNSDSVSQAAGGF
jgi:hypothetical protein